jgi:hypothetical protein
MHHESYYRFQHLRCGGSGCDCRVSAAGAPAAYDGYGDAAVPECRGANAHHDQ